MKEIIIEVSDRFGQELKPGKINCELTVKGELVRCKDCRYWLPMNRFDPDYHPSRGQCELNCWVRDFDWFCGDGDRRLNETDSHKERKENGNERNTTEAQG